MATNVLHSFQFIAFDRVDGRGAPPVWTMEQTELVMRPGVPGVGIVRTGIRGEPFAMRSFVDAESFSDGHQLLHDYAALIGADQYRLIWHDQNYRTQHQTDFVVLRLEPRGVRRVTAAAGGLTTARAAVVEAVWHLVAVPA